MDDYTGKHWATGLKTDVQRTKANIPAGGVEKLLFLGSSFFFLPPKNEEE
jgi:hypothetical protein